MKKQLLTASLLFLGIAANAQVKIGTNPGTIDPSSVLELEGTHQAFYINRVALTGTNDSGPGATVPNPKAGFVVYNTATTTGANAVKPGLYYFNGSIWVSTDAMSTVTANAWLLLGNSGTVDGVNYLGTNDQNPMNLRVNSQKSGRIEYGGVYQLSASGTPMNGNVAYGYGSQYSNTPTPAGGGAQNTSVGNYTLNVNTTGSKNAAMGYDVLGQNSTGTDNSGFGWGALQVNTTGICNTGIGARALNHNTTGGFNVAVGCEALLSTGLNGGHDSALTALGAFALYFNNGGKFNTATGFSSLFYNVTGSGNTSNGFAALQYNLLANNNAAFGCGAGLHTGQTGTGANNNTFLGTNADTSNVTGTNNTAVGFQAAINNTGSNNTLVGYNAVGTSANLSYAGAIGASATVCVSNALILGASDAGTSMTPTTSVFVGINECSPTQRLQFRNGHIRNTQEVAPGIALTTSSGTGLAALGVNSTDVHGTIITTNSNNGTTYTQVRVNFTRPATTPPHVQITPASDAASNASYYVTSDVNGFTLNFRQPFTTVSCNNPFPDAQFNYFVIE